MNEESLFIKKKDAFEKAKITPQLLDIEEAVIGALMIDQKGLDEIFNMLFPDIFYKKKHRYIYIAIQNLYNNSKPIDLYTVLNELKKIGKLEEIGGEIFLIKLTQKVISSAHIEHHSHLILQKFILRKLINLSSNIIKKCYYNKIDVFDLLNYSESKLFEINKRFLINQKYENVKFLVDKAINKIKKTKKEGLSGISTGFMKLDYITSGWQNSDLIIIASRPGMGKTTFMLSMVRNIVIDQKIPVIIFSIEMSSVQLITKLISSESEISLEKIKRAELSSLDWETLIEKTKKLRNSPLFIDDTPSLSIFDLRSKCRYLTSNYGIRLVFVDYMQLMGSRSTYGNTKLQNREQEISIISRNLKSISKELNIPIIALSQLSRAVETRGGDKRPLLSDLRESGAIEQDADIVLFIYRPEYYGFKTWDVNNKNDSCIGQAEVIIAKHRNGGLDNFRIRFIGNKSKFEDFKEKKIKSITLEWEEYYKNNVINEEKKLNNYIFSSSKNKFKNFNKNYINNLSDDYDKIK